MNEAFIRGAMEQEVLQEAVEECAVVTHNGEVQVAHCCSWSRVFAVQVAYFTRHTAHTLAHAATSTLIRMQTVYGYTR